MYLFLTVLGLHCCTQAFSSCGEQGLLSSCGARASRCSGFSLQRMLSGIRHVVVHGLSCPAALWNLPSPGTEPVSPCIGRRNSWPLDHQGSPEHQSLLSSLFLAQWMCPHSLLGRAVAILIDVQPGLQQVAWSVGVTFVKLLESPWCFLHWLGLTRSPEPTSPEPQSGSPGKGVSALWFCLLRGLGCRRD